MTVELGRDYLLSFECRQCGQVEPVNELLATVEESRLVCPACGAGREAKIISRLNESDPATTRRLSELGVPPGEILSLRTDTKMQMYQLKLPEAMSAPRTN